MTLNTQTREAIAAELKQDPGAIIEYLADSHKVRPLDVAGCLPEDQMTHVSAEHFDEVMDEMRGWGRITFIVHTPDLIFEAKGEIPKGVRKHGTFNMHGDIGGHIRVDRCQAIYFASRPFMGVDTHSVQFYSDAGNCMFKIYLGRDRKRNLIPEQVEKFKALRDRLCS